MQLIEFVTHLVARICGQKELDRIPFASEDQYWAAVRERMQLLTRIRRIESECMPVETRELARRRRRELSRALALREELDTAFRARVDATMPMPHAPRILRLARRLQLAHHDIDMLNYLVWLELSLRERYSERAIGVVSNLLGLSELQYLHLLDEDHPLRKAAIVVLDTDSLFARCDVEMPRLIPRILRGLPVKREDVAIYEKHVVGEILAEEPNPFCEEVAATVLNDPEAFAQENVVPFHRAGTGQMTR